MTMASKNKEGKAKAKKSKNEPSPEEQERLNLLERIVQCLAEANEEKELREHLVQQTEQLKQYWETEKNVKNKKKQVLLQKEHRLKEVKDGHAIELGKYKETIKDQLFKNQDELSRNAADSLINVKCTMAQHHREIGLQENGLHEISARIDTTVRSHEAFKTATRQWRDNITTNLREKASRRIALLASYSEKQFKGMREQCDRQLKDELKELESMHDGKIANAMKQNKQQIEQMRRSYNMTINDNLDTMTRLRSEVNELKEYDKNARKTLREMHHQNTSIVVPLVENKQSLQQLNADLELCCSQKHTLDARTKLLEQAEKELKGVEWDHEVLYQKLEALQKDYITQKTEFNDSIRSCQRNSNYQNLLLEERISKLVRSGSRSSGVIVEVLRKAGIKGEVPIADVVADKNELVRLLQEELMNLNDAHSKIEKRYDALTGSSLKN